MIVPIGLADLLGEIYHRICFPLYGLTYISRRRYIRIDRQKLQYLNTIQKLNCVYCGYVNGWLRYATEIAAATERYWCAIQHRQGGGFVPPAHHHDFVAYGDQRAFEQRWPRVRK